MVTGSYAWLYVAIKCYTWLYVVIEYYTNVVSRKYAPPFATLALVEMSSGSVDAGFILALPFYHGDLEPDCVGVSTRGAGSGGRA